MSAARGQLPGHGTGDKPFALRSVLLLDPLELPRTFSEPGSELPERLPAMRHRHFFLVGDFRQG